jgi:nodulation protein E
MNRRVVITGLGAVSGLGLNATTFWQELVAGQSAIKPLILPIEDIKISIGALVPEFDPENHFSSDDLTLLDRFSMLAVIAAREAVCDAGLCSGEDSITQAAAIIGSGCGGKHTDEATYDQLYKQQRTRAHPLTIPKGMPSAAASMVSKHLGIKGPTFALASACASGSHAIIQGCTMIQSGMVDVALVGASDAPFTFGLLKSWEALRVATHDTCRPFCADRSGIVLGEGAGMVVLESEQHAKARGARIYAQLAGCGMTSDAGHITRPDVTGISSAIINALDYAGINPDEVDYVNAHGTATQANDIAETAAINQVFGDRAKKLAVSSTKSMHGHALGASSALELIASTLAIYHGIVPPTANFTVADEQCDLDYVPNIAREQEMDVAISNSFAFGGLNSVIAIRKHS